MATHVASPLSPELRRQLLLTMLESRHGDLREESLNRQGKGHFHVSGRGHEALAAIGRQLAAGDYVVPYYRDRGLVLARGLPTWEMALEYFAKRGSASRGRMLPSHYSSRALNIWSVPTPTASQLLPACGMAWGMQLDGQSGVVITTLGDAASRQGDFYEAVCFAQERQLPILFIVEDNAYGISTPTRKINPLALKVLNGDQWSVIDGWNIGAVHAAARDAIAQLRAGQGPGLLWAKMERLSSHTSSDDHTLYRPKADLAALEKHDPILVLKRQMIDAGELSEAEFAKLEKQIKDRVRQDYAEAELAADPIAAELELDVVAPWPWPGREETLFRPGRTRMGDVVNRTLRAGLEADPSRLIFGEDVEDPKGGVFRLTQRLSRDFPRQVFNSPLAESTILGVACGLAAYGRRPVFELQFIDFIFPGFNQLVTNLATLRWRSNGQWRCPVVIYAPYGAYLPGGALWHSQTNESTFAHYPGLSVVVPSTPEDAAGLLWSAMHAEDPVLFLIPKHLLWAEKDVPDAIVSVPIGRARRCTAGVDVTVVAWGNTVEIAQDAVALFGDTVSVELIDLRSIIPWDKDLIETSVRKTGRLVVVQEDSENCSVGQMIISHLAARPDVWSCLVSPPVLVAKGPVMIGYNPIYERAALPDTARVVEAIRRTLSLAVKRGALIAPIPPAPAGTGPMDGSPPAPVASGVAAPPAMTGSHDIIVKVPLMGEGIRSARMVALLKKPGDAVNADEVLCEVETDKAVYPIESSFPGVFKEWKANIDETLAIGQEIALVTVAAECAVMAQAVSPVPKSPVATPAAAVERPMASSPMGQNALRKPALSQAITRRLDAVVPVSMLMDVRWDALRAARNEAKQRLGPGAPSPSLMISWCVTRAMGKHAAFRCLVNRDGSIFEQMDFELGVAVALAEDQLATAAIPAANKLGWTDFITAYHRAIEETRRGKLADVQAPVNISSLGAFGIESATPLVVPPAMSTLFIGAAHERLHNDGGVIHPVEVATVSLTFDHRIVNGTGAAAFLAEVKQQFENFTLPG
ncbi:MAG: thiamine pyrophosphate-dependent enzyme [Opitutaceae bacterium]|nr:thiamine pyrophosphate-dependent enzyme [Opitutaceae bacterium]